MRSRFRHLNFITTLIISLVALSICFRIETLNRQAGGFLPKTEPGKWRLSPIVNEEFWRRFHLPLENGEIPTRPLTDTENQAMTSDIQMNESRNKLRSTVSRIGLLQYPLLAANIALIIVGLFVSSTRLERLGYIISVAIVGFCGHRMLALEYFSSLGW